MIRDIWGIFRKDYRGLKIFRKLKVSVFEKLRVGRDLRKGI